MLFSFGYAMCKLSCEGLCAKRLLHLKTRQPMGKIARHAGAIECYRCLAVLSCHYHPDRLTWKLPSHGAPVADHNVIFFVPHRHALFQLHLRWIITYLNMPISGAAVGHAEHRNGVPNEL